MTQNKGFYDNPYINNVNDLWYQLPRLSNESQNEITMFTVKDIQKIFKCGIKQAYEIVNISGFPTIRMGKKILVEKKALQQWLEKHKGKDIIM